MNRAKRIKGELVRKHRLTDTTNPNRKHQAKRKLAKRLHSKAELERGTDLFKSLKWRLRRGDIENRVARHVAVSKQKSAERRAARNGHVHLINKEV